MSNSKAARNLELMRDIFNKIRQLEADYKSFKEYFGIANPEEGNRIG